MKNWPDAFYELAGWAGIIGCLIVIGKCMNNTL
jgi:hypothetical protein